MTPSSGTWCSTELNKLQYIMPTIYTARVNDAKCNNLDGMKTLHTAMN